jgi:hypothetical protein
MLKEDEPLTPSRPPRGSEKIRIGIGAVLLLFLWETLIGLIALYVLVAVRL